MSQIYKVNLLDKNNIQKIFVFKGKYEINESPNKITSVPGNFTIFSKSELTEINKKNIEVQYIDQLIYDDDSVLRVKEKILIECRNLNLSINQMYLFYNSQKKFNINDTYYKLTQKETHELNINTLNSFLYNFISNSYKLQNKPVNIDNEKQFFSFEDFNELEFNWDETHFYQNSLGQIAKHKTKYPYIANPFNCINSDSFILNNDIVNTQNSLLLFEFFPVKNNNIYLCSAENVINYAEENNFNVQFYLKLYFPLLYSVDNVQDRNSFDLKSRKLIDDNKKHVKKYYNTYNNFINLFYDLAIFDGSNDFSFTDTGINYFEFIIHPTSIIKLPLEILFKTIHSNEKMPLIKFNQGEGYENIYRIYTDDYISLSGVKIPYLYVKNNFKKIKILELMRSLSKTTSIGFYIIEKYLQQSFEIYCEFLENGNIHIKVDCPILISKDQAETLIKKSINENILIHITSYLKQSGYEYVVFNNFFEDNIEIVDINYTFKKENKKVLKLSSYTGCISSIFNLLSKDALKTSDEIMLTYKRVSGFKVMDSIKAFITTQRQKGLIGPILIQAMMENFPEKIPSQQKANEILAEWNEEISTTIETFGNKLIKIENNPGFNTIITNELTSGQNNTVVIVKNINDIEYIKYLSVFVTSLLKILTKKITTKENKDRIKRICKIKKNIDAVNESVDVNQNLKSGLITFDASIEESELDDADFIDSDTDEGTDDDFVDSEEEEELLEESEDEEEEEEPEEEEKPEEEEEKPEEEEEKPEKKPKEMPKAIDINIDDYEDESSLESMPDTTEKPSKTPSPKVKITSKPQQAININLDDLDDDSESLGSSDDEDLLDETDDDSMSGGSDSDSDSDSDDEELRQDLSHIKLKGQKGYMTQRLTTRDPELFLKKDKNGYKSFSKSCQSQYNRQPIILNDEELEYINSRDEDEKIKSYDEIIKYVNPNSGKKYNYICPRFWCLRDENGKSRSLSLKQINQGECGGWDALIPEGAKAVPRGKRIIEFSDERFHRMGSKIPKDDPARKLVYKPMYPGFLPKDKHPDGLCIPCCFQNPFTGEGKNKDDETLEYNYYSRNKGPNQINPTYDTDENNNIILDSIRGDKIPKPVGVANENYSECNETKTTRRVKKSTTSIDSTPVLHFPLKSGQLGYMNESLQKFLGFDNTSICYTSFTSSNINKRLKMNSYCILRLGIEKNKNQSFLCLLASIYPYYKKRVNEKGETLSSIVSNLEDFKRLFIKELTIEKFIQAQNGVLLQVFKDENRKVNLNIYKNNTFINSFVSNGLKKSIIQSYENFIDYFTDPNEVIDYTYIWDLVTKPLNKGGILFEDGINLLIFSNPNDDITDKIELICPTNHYSDDFYDESRKTVMVYNKNNFFEPLCKVYTKSSTKFVIYRFLSGRFWDTLDEWKENTDLSNTIRKIKKMLRENCYFKNGIIDKSKYDYKTNKTSKIIMSELKNLGISLNNITQIINSNSQVIGLVVDYKGKNIYIPTIYSGLVIDKNYIYIEEYSDYLSYEDTKNILEEISDLSNKEIPCKPLKKVIDNNMTVGIITETNQFVPVVPEVYEEIDEELEDLKVVHNNGTNNLLETDSNLMTSNELDQERIILIKKIDLENNFYSLFRNTFKVIINYDVNKEQKNYILDAVKNITIPYKNKLEYLVGELKKILSGSVKFSEISDVDNLEDINDLVNCLGLDKSKCKSKQYCFTKKNTYGVCGLILPKTNLYNGYNNKEFYFKKLADQIIRYEKIRKYLFTPRTFLSFQRINYKIEKDEIVVLEEILLEQYLKDVKLREKNNYIKTNKIYELVESKKLISSKYIDNCIVTSKLGKKLKITNKVKKIIVSSSETKEDSKKEVLKLDEYMNTSNCAFKFIELIINKQLDETISIEQIKQVLIDFYINANYPNELIPYDRGSDDNNWSFFSLVQWYSFQTVNTEKVHSQPMNKKNNLISDIIMRDNYMPTELDLIILLYHYNIPSIVVSVNKGFVVFPEVSKINIGSNDVDKFIIVTKVIKKLKAPRKKVSSTISFGLLKYNNSEYIKSENISSSVKTSNPLDVWFLQFIESRLKLQKKTKESKQKRVVKKIGKKKLTGK